MVVTVLSLRNEQKILNSKNPIFKCEIAAIKWDEIQATFRPTYFHHFTKKHHFNLVIVLERLHAFTSFNPDLPFDTMWVNSLVWFVYDTPKTPIFKNKGVVLNIRARSTHITDQVFQRVSAIYRDMLVNEWICLEPWMLSWSQSMRHVPGDSGKKRAWNLHTALNKFQWKYCKNTCRRLGYR